MVYLVARVGILIAFIVLGQAFVAADARALVRWVRYGVGAVMIGVGGVLTLARQLEFGVPLIFLGVTAIALGRVGPFDLGGGSRSSGPASRVQSAYLEMELDHDTGAMRGRVLGGAYAGRSLDDLDLGELQRLSRELSRDAESLALLEAYLDRRMPGWRDDVESDEAARPGSPPDTGAMTDEEAYEILGLAPGANEAEIRRAHRQLMKGVHPDQGGSTFLATKINEAKDRLLSRHR